MSEIVSAARRWLAALFGRPADKQRADSAPVPPSWRKTLAVRLLAAVAGGNGGAAADFAGALVRAELWCRERAGELERMLDAAREAVLPLSRPKPLEGLAALYQAEITRASPRATGS